MFSPGAVVGRLVDSSTGLAESGVTVRLIQSGRVVTTAVTDEAGYYQLIAPAKGDYRVEVVRQTPSGKIEAFDLPTHVAKVNNEITFGPSSLRGRLVDRSTGEGIANTKIDVYDENGDLLGTTTTDDEGYYSLNPRAGTTHTLVAPAGTISPAATVVPMTHGQLPNWRIVATTADGRQTERQITSPQAGDIVLDLSLFLEPHGRITDAITGQPVDDASVFLEWADPSQSGRFVLLPLDAGSTQPNPIETSPAGFYRFRVNPGFYQLSTSFLWKPLATRTMYPTHC